MFLHLRTFREGDRHIGCINREVPVIARSIPVDFIHIGEIAHLVLHPVADLVSVFAILEIDIRVPDTHLHRIALAGGLIGLARPVPRHAQYLVAIGEFGAIILIIARQQAEDAALDLIALGRYVQRLADHDVAVALDIDRHIKPVDPLLRHGRQREHCGHQAKDQAAHGHHAPRKLTLGSARSAVSISKNWL